MRDNKRLQSTLLNKRVPQGVIDEGVRRAIQKHRGMPPIVFFGILALVIIGGILALWSLGVE